MHVVRRWPKRRYAVHDCDLVSLFISTNSSQLLWFSIFSLYFLCLKFRCRTASWVLLMPCVFHNVVCFWNSAGLTTWFMIFLHVWQFCWIVTFFPPPPYDSVHPKITALVYYLFHCFVVNYCLASDSNSSSNFHCFNFFFVNIISPILLCFII